MRAQHAAALLFAVPAPRIRILSDIHYGDRASRVNRLEQLRPLMTTVSQEVVWNGDTLDTRRGPNPAHTENCRAEVRAFASSETPVTLLSGNHDPDLGSRHALELAGGRIIVTHGDVFFDEIVPWGRDAAMIRRRIAAALAVYPDPPNVALADRFLVWRAVAAEIPQRHQSERSRLKYALHFAMDTVWPPLRILRILRAWRDAPKMAAAFAQKHWPGAEFLIMGHTHRPGIWRNDHGPVVINTGSFCPPAGGMIADLHSHSLEVRRVQNRRGQFHPGEPLAEFPL